MSSPNPNYIEKAELFATRIINTEFSDKLVRHNLGLHLRIIKGIQEIGEAERLSEKDLEHVIIAGWLCLLGFKDFDRFLGDKTEEEFYKKCHKCTVSIANQFFEEINFPDADKEVVLDILSAENSQSNASRNLANVLHDAMTIDWAKPKAKKRVRSMYQEQLLTQSTKLSTGDFLSISITYLQNHSYKTDYGKKILEPKKRELILKLEKGKKSITKNEDLALKQELGITDSELKKLKKSLKSVKGRDERGVQTLFRTTSRNHYTMMQMVDRKANIMMSVNAIILSLIISRIIGIIDTFCIHNSPLLLILFSSIVSIFFAVIAIIPAKTHGAFSEQEVRNKEGNLLYFGNYHNMKFRDYEWGMLQMLNDSNYLYTSLIRDQYFLGLKLKRKHQYIRISLAVFLLGFITAVIAFVIVGSMSDFHIGGEHI